MCWRASSFNRAHQKRENFRVFVHFRFHVEKVNVESLNLRLELLELVQEVLTFRPLREVISLPVAQNLFEPRASESVMESGIFKRRCKWAGIFETRFQLLNHLKVKLIWVFSIYTWLTSPAALHHRKTLWTAWPQGLLCSSQHRLCPKTASSRSQVVVSSSIASDIADNKTPQSETARREGFSSTPLIRETESFMLCNGGA